MSGRPPRQIDERRGQDASGGPREQEGYDPPVDERPGRRGVSEENDRPPRQRREGVTESGSGEQADEVTLAEEREPQRQPWYGRRQQQRSVAESSQAGDNSNRDDNRRAEGDGDKAEGGPGPAELLSFGSRGNASAYRNARRTAT